MTDTYACGITVERPTEDLYDLLGLNHDGSPSDGHHWICDISVMSPSERYAYKALNDSHYKEVYDKNHDTADLMRAGFFDDGLPLLVRDYDVYDSTWMSTSVEKVRDNLTRNPNVKLPIVLVTTGGMAPIHNGHLAMMEDARRVLEAQGEVVVGGYFAPGHDSYVGQKYGGTAAIPASHRCAMVELATRDSDWLDCDPWAARYMPREINFTDVVDRLAIYLDDHLARDIRVMYVYGSDNEGFGAALPNESIMVSRTQASSKAAREGQHEHLDPLVRDYLLNWNIPVSDNLPYLIRNEEDLAIWDWRGPPDGEELTRRRIQLQSTIRTAIQQLFNRERVNHAVHLLTVEDQRTAAEQIIGDRRVISLDPFFNSNYYIHSTRFFALSSSQLTPLYRAARPGQVSLLEQAARIKAGSYVLVEDDTVTGATIVNALSLLPKDVVIEEQVILSDFASYQGTEYHDVVDLRDFIVGSKHGGLGVVLPSGERTRAPYVLPYVSLRARAKIPAEAELELSLVIWRANERFFRGSNIRIRQTYCLELAETVGFKGTDTMEAFCQWHINRLMGAL